MVGRHSCAGRTVFLRSSFRKTLVSSPDSEEQEEEKLSLCLAEVLKDLLFLSSSGNVSVSRVFQKNVVGLVCNL